MAANDYHFITEWRLQGTAEEVFDTVGDPTAMPRWWPAVYLQVHELQPGDARGVGKVVALHTKGWLPYTLRWQSRVSEAERPHHIRLEATGDFNGRGIWTITQQGDQVLARYDWKLLAEKSLLRYLSPLMKPIFAANHRWAMARGEESLALELQRRRARSDAARAAVPPPPQPTSQGPFLAAAAAVVVAAAAALALRLRAD